uniref:Putative endodeoxyribonuclease n=1 Tax=viral metagenome TaxID=1070528 RepID=A0A6M3LSC7_9ZZZZ
MGSVLVIRTRFPSLNDQIAAAKTHWSAYADQKRRHTNRVALEARAARWRRVKGPVIVRITWIEPDARRDLDNVAGGGQKACLDGLVQAGVLPNDTRQWVRGIQHVFPDPDKTDPRIEIELIPWT